MTRFQYWLFAAFFCSSLITFKGFAQSQGSPFGKNSGILKNSSIVLESPDTTISFANEENPFPYIDEREFYYNKREFNLLRSADKKGELEKLDASLGNYIKNFGPQNFRKNVNMIWRLARVKQIQEDTAMARFYYELAIKHSAGREAPRLAYDSLQPDSYSEWLPIDKYFELLDVREYIDSLAPKNSVLKSMGDAINSTRPDYAPFMHPTDSILIFTSRRDEMDVVDPFAARNEELFFSYIDYFSGEWMPAEKLPENINSKFSEGSACLSPDGLVLYFTRCGAEDGQGDCDIYQARYKPETDEWGEAKNLGAHINSPYWDSQPNISADGQLLFFASNRKGGFGGTDIYYLTKNENGEWSEASNLGPMINTPAQEVTPFFHKINRTLYFGSTGQMKNFGGYDIFKSRWMGHKWEEPHNVGPLVNSEGNEYYFSIDGNAETIFYAKSNNEVKDHVSQNFDLYSFPMPMEAQPAAITKLRCRVLDSITGNPLIGTAMIIDLDKGTEIMPKTINENGYFEFDLIKNRRYRIIVMGDDFFTIKKDFKLEENVTFNLFERSFEQNKPIVFESLQFGSNSDKLKSKIKPKLDYLVKFLETRPFYKLVVEGHTDSDGNSQYNKELSLRRAKKIAEYISLNGAFDEGRVTAEGYGASKPIVPNDTEENKRKNRRVEFKLILDLDYNRPRVNPSSDDLRFKSNDKEESEKDTDLFLNEDDQRRGSSRGKSKN